MFLLDFVTSNTLKEVVRSLFLKSKPSRALMKNLISNSDALVRDNDWDFHWVEVWDHNSLELYFRRIWPPWKSKNKKKIKTQNFLSSFSCQNPPVPDSVPSVSDKWAFDRVVMSPCYHTGSDEDLVAHLDASRQYDKCLLADSVSTGLRAWFGRRTELAGSRVECHGTDTFVVCPEIRDTALKLWLSWVGIARAYSTIRHAHLHDDAPRLL